jgi:hypothetical protein
MRETKKMAQTMSLILDHATFRYNWDHYLRPGLTIKALTGYSSHALTVALIVSIKSLAVQNQRGLDQGE